MYKGNTRATAAAVTATNDNVRLAGHSEKMDNGPTFANFFNRSRNDIVD